LIKTAVTTGDGLYVDEYEEGRYVYKGANPNNYITFNNETWRILAVESDGTLKIMKKDSIGNKEFDSFGLRDSTSNGTGGTYCADGSYGCNAWAVNDNFVNRGTVLKDAELNTHLNNDYYNTLSSESQNLIQNHTWGIGPVTPSNTDLAAQIASENSTTWNGKIGLMGLSDFIRANTNTEQCGNFKLNNSNRNTCATTNYIVSSVPTSELLWTISPNVDNSIYLFCMDSRGYVDIFDAASGIAVCPTLYLTSKINIEGEGTEDNPYKIVS
ncbi:MAG: hypothetical protein HFH47_03155, partial [Bacilli bacterium]|nr:hypothetical protein [Bacilli bacterium]